MQSTISAITYRQEIYTHYLGQSIEPNTFIKSLDREQINRQFQVWWGNVLPTDLDTPILDLGCGWGGFLAFLQTKGYRELVGVDASPQQIEIAKRLGLDRVEVGDIFATLAQRQNYYGCISAFNILEHLNKEEVLPFLKAAKAALKPGGCLLLEIPNASSLFGSRTRYWDFTHELSFCPTSLLQILSVTGFENVKLQERAPVVHGSKSWLRSILWKSIRQVLSLYLMVEQGSAGHKIFTQDMQAIAITKT
jgi:2-polyprenyl-3-methyl-5-hydroxy-6-metoxy-1,4-benzoquinol methylase